MYILVLTGMSCKLSFEISGHYFKKHGSLAFVNNESLDGVVMQALENMLTRFPTSKYI